MPDNSRTLNRASLEILYMELEKPLYNVVFRYVWNKEEAQDIVQESFVKLWKMKDKVEITTVKALVFKICINLARSNFRRKKILTFLSLDQSVKEPDLKNHSNLIKMEEIQILRKVIKKLPSKLKEIVLLTEFSDMSYDEIGECLGIPVGTVGSRRNKAIKMLKDKLKI